MKCGIDVPFRAEHSVFSHYCALTSCESLCYISIYLKKRKKEKEKAPLMRVEKCTTLWVQS